MDEFNGVSRFIDNSPIADIVTDACSMGGGAFCYGDIFYTNWKQDYPEISDLHINNKEATIAALSVLRWGHLFSNHTIVIHTDNTYTAAIINKCSCRNVSVMHLLRSMFWLSAKYNFVVKAKNIPGSTNVVADAISRLHEDGSFITS